MLTNMRALLKSCIVNLAVLAVWYYFEFQQFGALQCNRRCDWIVGSIYIIVLWWAFAKMDHYIHVIKDIVISYENKKLDINQDDSGTEI